MQPLWEREAPEITPILAVTLAAGETLTAFENIFPGSGKLEKDSPFMKQRLNFDENTQDNDLGINMRASANWRFNRSSTALIRYAQDKKFRVYREITTSLLDNISKGDLDKLTRTIPQTAQETVYLIQANHETIGRQFKVVSVLLGPDECFVFLSSAIDCNNVLVFWFQTSKGKPDLRQACFINHTFSAMHLNQIKEAVEKARRE